MQFPTRFWDSKVQNTDYFGHIPSSEDKRGYFSVFYDMTPDVSKLFLKWEKVNQWMVGEKF